MGHDNENWVESYTEGDNIFDAEMRSVQTFPERRAPEDAPLPADLMRAKQLLEARDVEALVKWLATADGGSAEGGHGTPRADAVLDAAFERLAAEGKLDPILTSAPSEIETWKLRAKAPIHFIHVDDVGAYKHTREAHFADYGYVVAQLSEGRPVSLQRTSLLGVDNEPISLLVR
jgi:hypothetical protein